MPTYLCWDDEEERPDKPAQFEAGSWRHAAETFAELVMGDYDEAYGVGVEDVATSERRVYTVERWVEYRAERNTAREKEPA